ncbi:hypothetical protein KY339_02290 [Candidatus Woesearchaeota archaeon]|nr:hypothetical protein [Candidatus Woesearchaeota archaeon]
MNGDDGKKEIPGFDPVVEAIKRFGEEYDAKKHERLVPIIMHQYASMDKDPEEGALEFHTKLKPFIEKEIEPLDDEDAKNKIRQAFEQTTARGRGFYNDTKGGKASTDGPSMEQILTGITSGDSAKLPPPPKVELPDEVDVDEHLASLNQELDDVEPEAAPLEPAPLTPTELPPKPEKPKSTFSEGRTYKTPGQPPAKPPLDFPEPTPEPAPVTLVAQVPKEPASVKPESNILDPPQDLPEQVIPPEAGTATPPPKPLTKHIEVPPPVEEEVSIPTPTSAHLPIGGEPSVVTTGIEGVSTQPPASKRPDDTKELAGDYLEGNAPPPAEKPADGGTRVIPRKYVPRGFRSFWTRKSVKFLVPNFVRYKMIEWGHGSERKKEVKAYEERVYLKTYFKNNWDKIQEYVVKEPTKWAERGLIKVEHVIKKKDEENSEGLDGMINGTIQDLRYEDLMEEKELLDKLEKEGKILEHTITRVEIDEFLRQDNETLMAILKDVKREYKTKKPHTGRRAIHWLTFVGFMTAAGVAVQYYAVKDLLFTSIDESVAAGQLTGEQGSNLKNVFYVKTKGVNTLKAYPVANGMQDEISQLERVNENMAKLDSLMGVANEYGKRPDAPEKFSEELKEFNKEYYKAGLAYNNMNVALAVDPKSSATGPNSEYLKKLGDDLENKVATANGILLLYDAKEVTCPECEPCPEPILEPISKPKKPKYRSKRKPKGIVGKRRKKRQTEKEPAGIEALESLYDGKATLRDTSRK